MHYFIKGFKILKFFKAHFIFFKYFTGFGWKRKIVKVDLPNEAEIPYKLNNIMMDTIDKDLVKKGYSVNQKRVLSIIFQQYCKDIINGATVHLYH